MNIVRKQSKSSRSYGRGVDNCYQPAGYAVYNERDERIGIILGTRVGYMQKSSWTVSWMSPAGAPRTVHYADSFSAAKAWAQTWDGAPPPNCPEAKESR